MRWLPWVSFFMSAGWIGCGFSSAGDDLVNPTGSGKGVTLDASADAAGGSSATGGEGGSSGGDSAPGGAAGVGANGGSGGSGGTAGVGGATGGTGGAGASAGSAGSSGGSGGTGGVGGGGTGGGTGGAGGGAEDCTNGVDDNDDGRIDCADPSCTPGYACAPRAAIGWSEPGYITMHGDEPSDCESLVPFGKVLHAGLQPSAAQCSCTCASPTGGACDGAGVLWQYAACAGGSASSSESCNAIPSNWVIGALMAYESTIAYPGTCESSVATTVPPVQWDVSADLCLPTQLGAGCGADHVCIPRAPQDADGHACIASSGNKACPEVYTEKRVFFETAQDTRACSEGTCACGEAEGQDCAGTYHLYADQACSDPLVTVPLDGNCHDTNLGQGEARSDRIVMDAPSGGQCDPQGHGAPIGSVQPSFPHTVCCLPQVFP